MYAPREAPQKGLFFPGLAGLLLEAELPSFPTGKIRLIGCIMEGFGKQHQRASPGIWRRLHSDKQ
jgi:hypothetical protein